ncbi:hypothetical protein HDV00_006459 [Rhizophlyctis rosea]|nr:hypothetical protein HDV00_006459 [Rhizophlyctis rosea]
MSISNPTGALVPTRHDIYPLIDPADPSSQLSNSAAGRTVIVTGAGRGIGRSIALNYAKSNAKVIVIAARTAFQLDEVETELKQSNPACIVVKQPTDVTDENSVKALIEAAVAHSEKGAPFTLVNNAGYGPKPTSILESDPKIWRQVWDINVNGPYLTTRYLLPHLSPTTMSPNYVINISSIGSRRTRPGLSAYQPSKTAVNRFTEFLQLEHGETHNLVTFAVHPGGVETELGKECLPEEIHKLVLTDVVICSNGSHMG